MKTPEDEAFEDIERRQGGGFKAKQAMAADKVGPFEKWWYYEGSCPPYTHHDCEEHTKRMCKIAWSNGAYVATQPAQEPVAWMSKENDCIFFDADKPNPMDYDFWTPLYTTPPKREWVGLTDEEIADYLGDEYHAMTTSELKFFRLGEVAAKEKNA